MWASVESGNVTEVYTRPKSLIIGDVRYPRNIFELWTEAELQAINIYTCIVDKRNWKDSDYYQNTAATYAYKATVTINSVTYKKVVTESYGTATAKSLTDVLYTATDESNGLGTEGELRTRGLKYRKKETINGRANALLQKYDWYTLRAASGGTAIPSSVSTYQAAVRTKANSMCTQIDNAADVDALVALYTYNDATPPVRPLGEFPDKPTL